MNVAPKLKLIALLVTTMGMPVSVMAINKTMFNGFYAGAGVGELQNAAQINSSASVIYNSFFSLNNQLIASHHENVFQYSGLGALYVGYGHFINECPYYLAAEVFINWAHRKNSLSNYVSYEKPQQQANNFDDGDDYVITATDIASAKLRNTEYGIDIRPGYLFDTNTLVYGRVGLGFNKVNIKNKLIVTYDNFVNFSSLGKHSNTTLAPNHSKNKTALRLGVGLEHNLSDNISVTADYIYTYYGKIKASGMGDSIVANGEDIIDSDISPAVSNGETVQSSTRLYNQAVMLGIKYYFYPLG